METDHTSLMPYTEWFEEASLEVVRRAIDYVAQNGLPGGHHFYITFATDLPGVNIPARVKALYPEEMTIVLQHRFWDLKLSQGRDKFSVGLSFSGIPCTLFIPFSALVAFIDPEAQLELRFSPRKHEQVVPLPAKNREEPERQQESLSLTSDLLPLPLNRGENTAPPENSSFVSETGAAVIQLADFRKHPAKNSLSEDPDAQDPA